MAQIQNDIARDGVRRMMQGGVAAARARADLVAKDYAVWDPLYTAILQSDEEWLIENVGTGVFDSATKDRMIFTVAGTRPGIAPQDCARTFKRFEQVDGSMTRAAEGSGLGLTIAKSLGGMMGGQITLRSTLGKGSVFSVEAYFEAVDFGNRGCGLTARDGSLGLSIPDKRNNLAPILCGVCLPSSKLRP